MKDLLAVAGFNTILGIGTVFIMLIIMSLIIYCFRLIPKIQGMFTKKPEQPAQTAKPVKPQVIETQSVDLTDDMELVAVIAAAIAASEQVPIDSFQVRTIKRRR